MSKIYLERFSEVHFLQIVLACLDVYFLIVYDSFLLISHYLLYLSDTTQVLLRNVNFFQISAHIVNTK